MEEIVFQGIDQFYLVKRKKALPRKLVQSRDNIIHKEKPQREFFSLLKGRADTLIGKSLVVGFSLAVSAESKPFESWVVFTVKDKNKKTLRYERIPFDWLRTDWSNPENRMVNSIYVNELPPESDKYFLFVWNINKVSYQIINGKASVFVLENE